jgi:hypothetical protein
MGLHTTHHHHAKEDSPRKKITPSSASFKSPIADLGIYGSDQKSL